MAVAVVDDSADAVKALSITLEDADLVPRAIGGGFNSIDAAVEFIHASTQAAVCDHRLSAGGYANFYGAQLVAELYAERHPAVLLTQYADVDQLSIREFRDRIPVLLSRDEAESDNIVQSLNICKDEIDGKIMPSRMPWRTLVRFESKYRIGAFEAVDAVIPGWDPHQTVGIPITLLPGDIRTVVDSRVDSDLGIRTFAYVNIGAESKIDLFMYGFEMATTPRANDGLS